MKNIRAFTNEYELYLRDESKKEGTAEFIAFPENSKDVSAIVKKCAEEGIAITVQGGRTGVGSGAVPGGGCILSMEKLRKLEMKDDGKSVIAGAGISLGEMNAYIRRETGDSLFFPPDPTEGTASAGGIVSCNSSGARSFLYGPVRNHVLSLEVVLADGRIIRIRRGKIRAVGRTFDVPLDNGSRLEFELPGYSLPESKNSAGYYVHDDMDLIDLFIGSEGTLGIVTEVEFKLETGPGLIWGIVTFFDKAGCGVKYVDIIKQRILKIRESIMAENRMNAESVKEICGDFLMSAEYFDRGSLELLRKKGWDIPENHCEAVFNEIKSDKRSEMIEIIRLVEKCIIEAGGISEDARVAGSIRSFVQFKEMRHAAPEAVNEIIAERKKNCPVITKLGSDMSVPDDVFGEVYDMYINDLAKSGLEYVIFGHIGDNHLHVNILSRNGNDYLLGKKIFSKWAEKTGRLGGSTSAEHGVGKLKRELLVKMYGNIAVNEMRELKKYFDPDGILGRDNIFVWNSKEI